MQWGLNVHQQPRQLDKRFASIISAAKREC